MEILYVLIPLFVVGLAVVAIVGSGLSSKCPSCTKWWSLVEKERVEVGRSAGSKTITLQDVQKDASGKTVGRVDRQQVVPTERIAYDSKQQCKHCGHETHKQVIVENVLSPKSINSMPWNAQALFPEAVDKAKCNLCNGFGSRLQEQCPACSGVGTVLVSKPPEKCSHCMGFGKRLNDLCPICGGSGWSNRIRGAS